MEGQAQDTPASSLRIYASGIIASLIYTSCGCIIAWTSPTFPILRKNHAVTPTQEPWIGSLFSFGAAFGPIVIGVFNDRIGRKRTIYLLASMIFISWLILLTSQDFYVICLGRIIGGVGLGGSFTGTSIFVSEIADVKRRGSMGSFMTIFLASGYLIEYCVGPYVSYVVLILVSLSAIVLFLLLFYFLPESPVYFVASGQNKKAIDSLCWYRGGLKPHEVQNELKNIEVRKNEKIKATKVDSGLDSVLESPEKRFWPTMKVLFTRRGAIKGLLISMLVLALQQLSGFGVIMAYAQDIFSMTKMELAPQYGSMIIGASQLVSSLPSPILVRRFGLKPVLVVATFGAGISVGFLSLYFYLVSGKYDIVSKLDFLPLTSLLAYLMFFNNGAGPLAWAVTSEMFLPEVKSTAMPFCGVISSLLGFAVMQAFSGLTAWLGIWGFFCVVSVIAIVGAIGILLFVPNTTGMTMTEIQDFLDPNRNKN